MGIPTIHTGPMTVEEFYAFTDRRPDNEKWELIEGEPILNASPSRLHQWIVKNLAVALTMREREQRSPWTVLPGLGVRVSSTSRPEPDVLVIPGTDSSLDPLGRDRSDVIVAFEVLSPSTENYDLRWKRSAYTKLPSLTHYIVIAQDVVDVLVLARAKGFADEHLQSLHKHIDLPSLAVSLPLTEIYRDTGLDTP